LNVIIDIPKKIIVIEVPIIKERIVASINSINIVVSIEIADN
jgi:hypothetical protein